jgi:hypothetical protein
MSLIKPRTRGKQFVQHRTRLELGNHEVLHAYAAFIGEDVEYVLNELIDAVLAKDKAFVKWRSEHPQSFAPRVPAARASDARPRSSNGDAPVSKTGSTLHTERGPSLASE